MENNQNMTQIEYLNLNFQKNQSGNYNFKNPIINTDNNKRINMKIFIFIIIIVIIIYLYNYYNNSNYFINVTKKKYDINFDYKTYENNIITKKIITISGWQIRRNQANFLNGLIRKYKPKNCLEIGVANGGSSILILNAIKDITNSILVSLDLNNKVYSDPTKETGYRVKYFPELSKNWKLFTGDQPHKFLIKLNMKFDFVFLDTAHSTPGEILNFIELLPFLNENAILVIHDILWHFKSKIKFYPSNIILYPAIYGDKILLKKKNGSLDNIAAVFLYKNQENHYLDYFLLLLTSWEYLPKNNEINDLRFFIKNYYKKNIFLKIFDTAVMKNMNSINIRQKYNGKNSFIDKKKQYFIDLVYGKKTNYFNRTEKYLM